MGGSINQNVLADYHTDTPMDDLMTFAYERQQVFHRKERNDPWPWSTDEMFHTYKFCNIFRDQDKTTKWILDWVKDLEGETLLANLIYARFCNNPDVMLRTGYIHQYYNQPEEFIRIIDFIGGGKTAGKVNKNTVWKDPYQIAGAFKTKLGYPYREHLLAYHIKDTTSDIWKLLQNIDINEDLTNKLEEIAEIWGYRSTMAFTQVILDLSHLGYIPESVYYPLGDGAKPVIKLLDKPNMISLLSSICYEWNTRYPNERRMRPMDAEGALCEWRKYLVWKNGLAKKYRKYERKLI